MIRSRKDDLTLDLLAWQPPQVAVTYEGEEAREVRGATISARFARAISKTLRDGGRDRTAIAAEMSDYLGEQVTKAMLDAYASEARDSHNINLPRFAALIHVTGDHRLLSLLPEMFGFAVVDEKYAGIIELHLIEEHERDLAARKAQLTSGLRRR
ncbi:MAG: DNA transposition protein [Defluviimonas sp.]|nr:hypothetical protein [Rhodobiaceae bacterium]MCC0054305.1 DNA transposition protein [Rhodobiaceae bacterium]MCC0065406.1 DNA transposition protein [Defluviimonas sp.]